MFFKETPKLLLHPAICFWGFVLWLLGFFLMRVHTRIHKKRENFPIILPVTEGLGTSVWHWDQRCLFSAFSHLLLHRTVVSCSHWAFMVSACLRNDRTLLTFPEVAYSGSRMFPSERNSGKNWDPYFKAEDRNESCDREDTGSRHHKLETKG